MRQDHIDIALHGLPDAVASDLLKSLSKLGAKAYVDGCSRGQPGRGAHAAIIFCYAGSEPVRNARERNPHASIIAVSCGLESSAWLDSIEAGADDYCASPVEESQLQWMIESSIHQLRLSRRLAS